MSDFTRYSYDEQVARMTELLRVAPGWGEGFDSTMGQSLIQLVADVTDNLHFMLERRTIESYITTASLRSSIIARASEMGYRFKRVKSNSGMVKMTLIDGDQNILTAQSNITIPALTSITNSGNQYVLAEDLIIQTGESEGTALIKHGTPRTIQISPTDETFQTRGYILIRDFEQIENGSFIVRSGGIEYLDVAKNLNGSPARRALSFLSPNDAYYDIRYEVNGMRVIFGDNLFGKKPDDFITIEYVEVDPNEENETLLMTGVEFSLGTSEVFDMDGNSYQFKIENTTQIRGASPQETNEQIKENAIAYHKTNGRAVTLDDYNFWIRESGIGNIIDARTSGEYELDSIVYNMNNVYITYLTASGEELTLEEKQHMIEYLRPIQMAGVHNVIHPADLLGVKINLMPVRDRDLPISNSEFYNIIYRFLDEYFQLRRGSIGREIQKSDIINAMYGLRTSRNGIEYKVIDYVRIDMEAIYPFSVPVVTNNAVININTDYTPSDGDEFVILIDNSPVFTSVDDSDTRYDILLKARDNILAETKIKATMYLRGATVDEFGWPEPFNLINSNPLFNYITPQELDTDIELLRRYFSPRPEKLDIIPVYDNTEISFTAPSDTDIIVWRREDIRGDSEETITTVTAGSQYSLFADGTYEGVRLEPTSQSSFELQVVTIYPSSEGVSIDLVLETPDSFGKFSLDVSHGDLSEYVTDIYRIILPRRTQRIGQGTRNILEGSLQILDSNSDVVYTSNAMGDIFDSHGNLVSGWVNHRSGEVELPVDIADGDYMFKFSQDKWQNLRTDALSALSLIPPKPTLNGQEVSLSTIEVE